jgi:lipopolysaccharide export system protein LptC
MKNLLAAIILVLVAGAGAVYFTARAPFDESVSAPSGTSPPDEDYDYYVQNMRTTRFNSSGQPASQLEAERVTHFPDGDRAELQMPAFKSFGVERDAWQVSAETGTLAPDAERGEDRLELAGAVQLYKPLAAGDFADVRTTALTVFTDSEEAASDVPVALEMRDTHLEGVGLRARLTENYFQLNDSKGSHDPATRP